MVTVLGAPLVALVSVPLELGATLAGRGGELVATARELPLSAARQSARRQIRLTSGRASARGACWPEIAPARLSSPGTTTRRPRSAPSTAALATSSTGVQTKPGHPLLGVRDPGDVGELGLHRPGQTTVTVTPAPESSAWVASLRLSTNALVAA